MPQRAWSPKRELQYEHIKESLEDRGADDEKTEEVAARTVNKERARAGETKEPSRTSIEDISSGRRGGLRSTKVPADELTTSSAMRRRNEESKGGRGCAKPSWRES